MSPTSTTAIPSTASSSARRNREKGPSPCYDWDSAGVLNRFVVDPHDAMVNTSHSRAVGSASVPAGAGGMGIDTNIDMSGYGMSFKAEHEAVFKWECAKTWVFYSKLWDELDLPGTKAP